jgi:hypothetical protein
MHLVENADVADKDRVRRGHSPDRLEGNFADNMHGFDHRRGLAVEFVQVLCMHCTQAYTNTNAQKHILKHAQMY